jgi:hypothetical protein
METQPNSILDSINEFVYLMQASGFDADVGIDQSGLITVLINPNSQSINPPQPTNRESYFDMDIVFRNNEEDFNQLQINELSPMQNNALDDGNISGI